MVALRANSVTQTNMPLEVAPLPVRAAHRGQPRPRALAHVHAKDRSEALRLPLLDPEAVRLSLARALPEVPSAGMALQERATPVPLAPSRRAQMRFHAKLAPLVLLRPLLAFQTREAAASRALQDAQPAQPRPPRRAIRACLGSVIRAEIMRAVLAQS